jgi:transketolase
MMRAVHGSTVLYPSDATSTAALAEAMAGLDGISYLRTTRGAYPVLYLATAHLAVREMGGSGTTAELLDAARIDAAHIAAAARRLLS